MLVIGVHKGMDYIDDIKENMLEKAKTARAQAASDISADIRKMINNPHFSDIVFCCKDGAHVHASRLFLVARSVVLHRMLSNGMAESQLSKVTLHGVSSTALLPVMEFLYTGTLQEYGPKGWKDAFEIIDAARFFLLESLEIIVMDFLLLAATEVEGDLEAAAEFLSIIVRYVGDSDEIVNRIGRILVCILKSASLEPKHLHVLTCEAFLYFLENTRAEQEASNLLLNAEFLRLKNIILWCACKAFVPKDGMMSHAIPPEITSTLQLMDEARLISDVSLPEIYSGIKSTLALSVKEYLPMVDLRRISPNLLINIFESMDVLPPSAIMDAYRFHAFRASHSVVKDEIRWFSRSEMQKMYRMSTDGSMIQQVAPGMGFAKYDLEIYNNGLDRYFKWEITIEDVCDGFIEIGLYHGRDGAFGYEDDQSLSGQPGGWAFRMDPQGLSINRSGEHEYDEGDPNFVPFGKDRSELVYGKDYAHRNSKVNVHFNMVDSECSFSVDNDMLGDFEDGESCKIAWADIPHGPVFPAVSLGTGSGGRVRFKMIHYDD